MLRIHIVLLIFLPACLSCRDVSSRSDCAPRPNTELMKKWTSGTSIEWSYYEVGHDVVSPRSSIFSKVKDSLVGMTSIGKLRDSAYGYSFKVYFPEDIPSVFSVFIGSTDTCYSVIHGADNVTLGDNIRRCMYVIDSLYKMMPFPYRTECFGWDTSWEHRRIFVQDLGHDVPN